MSYCRWSSDNGRCDLYCYEDCAGGFTTHVAGNRIVGDIPTEPSLESPLDPGWAERAPIGLAHDGETFNDPDLRSFLARLVMLREAGYSFPDYVLDDVRSELDGIERL